MSALSGGRSLLPSANIDGPVHLLRWPEAKHGSIEDQKRCYQCEGKDEAACSKAQRE
ncbi:MAG: hypothetical protein WDN23_08810 [Edaphobacter sp.]